MLVYANHFKFQGADAEEAIFKAVGVWFKKQLGFGLHPEQLKKDGEFNGFRNQKSSWLRVYATSEAEPAMYAWILKNADDSVRSRQWITELGFKRSGEDSEVSCVVRTDEHSVLAGQNSVMASRPRVIGYIVRNIRRATTASFAPCVDALDLKTVGEEVDSYRAISEEIERSDRTCPLVLVSPTREGDYLIDAQELQETLVGLGQVVQVPREFNSRDMERILGRQYSAWGGAVNVVYLPLPTGVVRNSLFRAEQIQQWGEEGRERIAHVLGWVTNNTNISRLRERVRPEGVMQLASRRRMQAAIARSGQMDAAQLRAVLEAAERQAEEYEKYFSELAEENSQLEARIAAAEVELEETRKEVATKNYRIQTLEARSTRAEGDQCGGIEAATVVEMICRDEPPLPAECLDLIARAYGSMCTVLPSARASAEEMKLFTNGRTLLNRLRRLVTEYRSRLMEGGDNYARTVFGGKEYAAKESETVMANREMRRQRTFFYEGENVEMFRHLRIGVDDNLTRTIRVHFHWDAKREKIVIGYCGEHLTVASC